MKIKWTIGTAGLFVLLQRRESAWPMHPRMVLIGAQVVMDVPVFSYFMAVGMTLSDA